MFLGGALFRPDPLLHPPPNEPYRLRFPSSVPRCMVALPSPLKSAEKKKNDFKRLKAKLADEAKKTAKAKGSRKGKNRRRIWLKYFLREPYQSVWSIRRKRERGVMGKKRVPQQHEPATPASIHQPCARADTGAGLPCARMGIGERAGMAGAVRGRKRALETRKGRGPYVGTAPSKA